MTIACPHCKRPIGTKILRAHLNRIAGKLGGRPRTEERCNCGVMTAKRAAARAHKC